MVRPLTTFLRMNSARKKIGTITIMPAAAICSHMTPRTPLMVIRATCMVRISRPMISAKRNSFQDMIKAKTDATRIPGRISGSDTKIRT